MISTVFRVKDENGAIIYAAIALTSFSFKDGRMYFYTGARGVARLAEGTMTETRLRAALERARQYNPLVIDFTNPAYLSADDRIFFCDGPEPAETAQEPGQIAVFEAPTAINTSGSVAFTVKAPS